MATARKRILILSLLVLTVVGGFALRTTFNMDAATTPEGEFLLSGNDPYYHKHAVDHITESWETLEFDPMLNYPAGSTNPNPPLYEWSVAVGGAMMEPFAGSLDTGTWWSILYSPAIWGALTIIPAYLIGKEFAGPWGGLLAAFLLATSPEHMSRTSLGFSDHDAINLFLITFGSYFVIQSIKSIGTNPLDTRVRDLGSAFQDWFGSNRRSSGAALAAGGFFGALALVWKGFPYVFGILLAYTGLQFLMNHWRGRDVSRPLFALTTTLGTAALLSLPHYASFGLMHFWQPALFILAALITTGVFFLATQRYPSVLVIPGLVLVAGVFAGIMFLVVPDIAAALLNRFVYFQQNALYQTIAEARPASFSNLSFTVGPIPLFLYIVGFPWLVYRVWDQQRAVEVFFLSWAVVDLFMGISAVRFLSLIVPSMAILAAATTVWLIKSMDLPSLAEGYKRAGGGWRGIRRATGMMHIVVIFFVGFMVLAPNAFLAADAAVPANYENQKVETARASALEDVKAEARSQGITGENLTQVLEVVNQSRDQESFRNNMQDRVLQLGLSRETGDALADAGADEFGTIGLYAMRLGAFGQSFLPDGWRGALTWMAGQDTQQEPADRPAFLAWWDYGHWSIAVGEHPAVADNFQNGYQMTGNFLVAQNESHAIQLMGARMAKADTLDAATYKQTLTDRGISQERADALYDAFTSNEFPYIAFANTEQQTREISQDWLSTLEDESGKKIRYVAADNRMLPVDNPNTRQVESGSIYYAPVTLAGEDPDDYVETATVNMQTGEKLSEEELRQLRRSPQQQDIQIGQRLFYKDAFFNSMYYRAFIGLPAREPISQGGQTFPIPFNIDSYPQYYQSNGTMLFARTAEVNGLALTQEVAPGFGLEHFRLVKANNAVRMLQYYPGATVEGTVTSAGQPMEGVRVTAFDDAGDEVYETNTGYFESRDRSPSDLDVPHDSTLTGPDGAYTLTAPFGTDRGVEIRVTQDTAQGQAAFLANATREITIQEAEEGATFTIDFQVPPSNVQGTAFHDADRDGTQDANETVLDGIDVTIQNRTVTTGPDGSYSFTDLAPGQYPVSADADGFALTDAAAQVSLEPGNTTPHALAFEFEPIPVNGTIVDQNGTGAPIVQASFTPTGPNGTGQQGQARSDFGGNISTELQPGSYEITVDDASRQAARNFTVTGVEIVTGTGASATDTTLVLDRDAENVEIRITVERTN